MHQHLATTTTALWLRGLRPSMLLKYRCIQILMDWQSFEHGWARRKAKGCRAESSGKLLTSRSASVEHSTGDSFTIITITTTMDPW